MDERFEAGVQDIKILSLYKQHYFNEYNPKMETDYSCWGYYDGISVSTISEEDKSKLFRQKSNACISRIWYGATKISKNLDGTYSKQNIGMFRCLKNKKKQEELEEKSPFFAVAFVQLKERENYQETVNTIENLSAFQENNKEYILLKVYYTYDNADLIVLLYSNNLNEIDKSLYMIEKDPKICYIHSIMGVKEEYLKECKESSTVLSFWKGIKCFIDENIALVTLNIATSGNEETIGHLKKQFSILGSQNGNEDFLSHVNFFNMSGHANIKINISDISVKAFLIMFLDEGMATHSSVLFGNEIYNIETNLSMRGKRASDIQEIEISGQGAQKQKELWFKKLTTKYKEKAKEAWEKEDEGTYSYYCALVQVVNTMTQYEGFSLSRDIYTLLYPSFKLFDEQLDKALKDAKGRDNLLKMKDIKESICEFISAVNSVIYHITHTDQIFLMIPGNTGMIFSIPSKLCLMYLWVIRGVIKLLNDANYKFSCLLTPDLEASPSTKLINMGLFVNDRLIRFMTSQRFLYMPRHFMILSTHEIAHYVGKEIRNRELRFKNIAKTLSYLLAEGIFPEKLYEETDGKIAEIYEKLKEEKKAELQERCVRFIFDEYRDIKKSGNDKKEHATEIVPFLKKSYRKLLVKNGCVDKLLRSCVKEAWEGKLDDDSLKAAFITEEIQDKLEWYREMLLTSQTVVDACIDELMLIYREIFSDVAAACILGYEGETFAEVFSVSEGNKYNSAIDNKDSAKGYGDIQKKVREKILKDVFSEEADEKSVEKPDEVYTAPLNLRDELYTYQWVEIYLKKYAQKSKDDINAKIKERREELDKIRELYTLFADREATCDMIYNKIINIIIEYQKEI